ncbi:carotenoid 1,2-hydratase [bacterium (Candidatus Blackallbacteria) CG17_big_fil_post_rev_8_21_14_2_50_48_46]|uniref:Carotenoid 1,2-hydratase n=1 Tax=bacterium (Candidatus Blackallbacteria) CG17_big_fil_post_rev_8_21_14_2_50_48_46 TaxID=2014261 RepID=A0A2M7GAN8_9BACT|nr:MAG: carotenoid 1,2-hydratase [bacterium (Candidatus Blackallbacteria) CG18_big_fil_WC_8_21_14_2_50_49_26]PIW19217.1 MAG: carotenoid 1,2-hydratase [bacterium (Candidatus Blackallbacteria) CG17_big_fil_post_rev_8_21_14_2_50_48_46]PIW45433.1 MAG: carotenoid 1,2-hydratase [bacterium (Candidatus Blackallbacteria) CG13_big_fil_rev_8_21_14_2_50_49_14]
MQKIRIFLGYVLLLSLFLQACEWSLPQNQGNPIKALNTLPENTGFKRALAPIPFQFPRDSGPHPDFQTEWWYYTGNLATVQGRRFGYQLTFFRRGLKPGTPQNSNPWASHQIYFAHLALSDIQAQKFHAQETWNRGAQAQAGAEASPFRVWVNDWEVKASGAGFQLHANTNAFELNFRLDSQKPIVLHGNQGLSQKSAEKGNASYYYSQTRLKTQGFIKLKTQRFEVKGLSWLDREWSTSVLSKQQVGWDWFSLQLDDQRELMLYQIRNKSGSRDPVSSGSLIDKNGKVVHLVAQDFKISKLGVWKSPQTGIQYPSGWKVEVPAHQLSLSLEPLQKDQELRLGFTYWEGAVKIKAQGITGFGYVELTGYP